MPLERERFWEALCRKARDRGYETALLGDRQRVSWAQLRDEVQRCAGLLEREACGPLVLALDNDPQTLLWDLAALFSDRPCVLIPAFFSGQQFAHCLAQSGACLALADQRWTVQLLDAGFSLSGSIWRRAEHSAPAPLPAGTAKITYTSGSTGQPKGVCLGAAALLRVASTLEQASRETSAQRYLAVLPLGVLLENLGVYAALMAGACVVLYSQAQLGIEGASRLDLQRLIGAITRSATHSLILVPQLLLGLVVAIERGLMSVGALRFVAVGGARVTRRLLERAEAVGLPVYQGYGLSECASVVTLNRPGASRLGSVGKPLAHVQVRLADDGEVLVAGSTLLGYLGEAPIRGDWWATGDFGHFDEQGYLYLDGRKTHRFITSFGRNVNPEWVEAELTQSGLLAQAFVHGEGLPRNRALLWPRDPTASDALIEQAVEQCNAGLPDYAQVHDWRRLPEALDVQLDTLTANGRPRREAILARYHQLLSDTPT